MVKRYDDPRFFRAGHAERLAKALNTQHADFIACYEKAIRILSSDPYNRTGSYQIKKLEGIAPGLRGVGVDKDKERRKRLASLSFSEKLKILEKLRDRDRAIAASGLRKMKLRQEVEKSS